ncbi:MAG: hypothetical protein ACRBHB_07505 [Arenicella sp.]
MQKKLNIALVLYIIFVFGQSLFFKFQGSEETVIIFSTIADWMASIGIPAGLAELFKQHGGNAVGIAELIACFLLIFNSTRFYGALLSLGVISGAIFFHLFTPLGVNRVVDAAGNTDGGILFFMACGVWVCSFILLFTSRKRKGTFR